MCVLMNIGVCMAMDKKKRGGGKRSPNTEDNRSHGIQVDRSVAVCSLFAASLPVSRRKATALCFGMYFQQAPRSARRGDSKVISGEM